MLVAYLGPQGSYTHKAAQQTYPLATHLPQLHIQAVFQAIAAGEAIYGVVPFENMIQGPVTETLDALYAFRDHVAIANMYLMPIEHALGSVDATHPLAHIYSKDQALHQCSHYLREHYPDAQWHETTSTSAAVHWVQTQQTRDAGVIADLQTLQDAGLNIRARSIGNQANNKTRFIILKHVSNAEKINSIQHAATALMIYPHRDRTGLLQDILNVVSGEMQLSCLAIHSRPDTLGAFRFFFEVEGDHHNPRVQACVERLQNMLGRDDGEVFVFGSYPRCSFHPQHIQTIGIVGGTGKMGQWFQKFFERADYRVLICDQETPLSIQSCVEQSNAILINVPIHHTQHVIQKVCGFLKAGQLLVDNTSVKTMPVKTMLQYAPEGVEVLGMHTVFGPKITHLKQENVIFTSTHTCGDLSREFQAIFHRYGACVTSTTPEYHDLQMAFHQNLEHFSKRVLHHILTQYFPDAQDIERYASPNSRGTLAAIERIMHLDPSLFHDIQHYNPYGADMILSFVEACNKMKPTST